MSGRWRKAWTGLFTVLALLGGQTHAAEELSVVDDSGRVVRLAAPARRVVALAPDLAEMMYAAGAGANLVGVVDHSDFPAAAKSLPRVGDAHGFDLERILALQPDLVIAWAGGNAPQHLARLEALGLRLYRSDIRDPEGIASTVERLGRLAGSEAAAGPAAAELRRRLLVLREQFARRSELSVSYQVWGHPLYTLGGTHLVSAALKVSGARNVFEDLSALAAVIETESVLKRDPDVIIAAGDRGARPAWLDGWTRWPQLKAVRLGRLLVVDADLMNRHSPRFVDGTEALCLALDRQRGLAVQ